MRKSLRYLLNRYGRAEVERVLAELVANPTPRHQALWPEEKDRG